MKEDLNIRPEILLHPNIPKPLHGLNPRSILGQRWWDTERQIAYAKEDYHCWACGVAKAVANYHGWLEAHECYQYNYAVGTAKMIEIVALCHSCHNYIHRGRLAVNLQAGRISQEKFDDILAHGLLILDQIDTTKNPYIVDDSSFVEWGDWALILEGKEYHSKFANYAEWRKFYSRQSRKEFKETLDYEQGW